MAIRPERLNVLSLCSGVGGIELGLMLATGGAARTVCYVEREAYPAAILAARMEEGHLDPAPIWSDLRTFDARRWRGRVDLVTGGYPCQPFSVAGKQRAGQDPRHLWPEVLRVLVESEAPLGGFFENVRGHVSKGLRQVLADLASFGFDAEWDLFSAEEEGAPHRRERLFILAHADSQRQQQQGGLKPNERGRAGDGGSASSGEDLANSASAGPSVGEIPGRPQKPEPAGPGWWASEPTVGRVAHGVANRVDRLRACGNGVVPAVAARAFRELLTRVLRSPTPE